MARSVKTLLNINVSFFIFQTGMCLQRLIKDSHKHLYLSPLQQQLTPSTAEKMKFSIKDLFSKCDQIRRFLQIWSHLLKKSLMENFMFVQWYQMFAGVTELPLVYLSDQDFHETLISSAYMYFVITKSSCTTKHSTPSMEVQPLSSEN